MLNSARKLGRSSKLEETSSLLQATERQQTWMNTSSVPSVTSREYSTGTRATVKKRVGQMATQAGVWVNRVESKK